MSEMLRIVKPGRLAGSAASGLADAPIEGTEESVLRLDDVAV